MNEIIEEKNLNIKDIIYEIRGKQVMLDSDLAKLYRCKNGTKTINLAVKRHINRFPERFMFQLSEEESKNIWFQAETKYGKLETRGGKYNKPYAFTEQGVAMLATVLRTEVAEEVSVQIMDAFVAMRHYIGNNLTKLSNIESKVIEHDNSIKLLQESFNKLEEEKEVNEIYFNGKIYDAYSKILDIFKESKKELIIVDRYVDKTILDMIKNLKCNVILITSFRAKLTKLDIDKYNKTYNNLKIFYNETFHDRYFIIDEDKIYHSGNSINHIGYRKSSVDNINDKNIKETILKDIKKVINRKEN